MMIKKLYLIFSLSILFLLYSCKQDVFPKPKAYLTLEYPTSEYHRFINDCPYSFAISKSSNITFERGCDAKVFYPKLQANVHITYRRVNGNLKTILQEADKLTTEHTIKANAIIPKVFENKKTRVYGVLNDVKGESASNIQFYATDSVNHVLTGALYFEVKPNYDSLYPAVDYLKNDIMKMIETLEWGD